MGRESWKNGVNFVSSFLYTHPTLGTLGCRLDTFKGVWDRNGGLLESPVSRFFARGGGTPTLE